MFSVLWRIKISRKIKFFSKWALHGRVHTLDHLVKKMASVLFYSPSKGGKL